MRERKINHGFWATPTDYQRLTEAAEKKRIALGLRKLPLGDYIMMMLDRLNQGDAGKTQK